MKKTLLTFIATSFSAVVMAQGIAIGARTGLNLATENISNNQSSTSTSFRAGFLLGGYLTASLSDKIAIQPELFYSSTGSSFKDPTVPTTGTIKTNYLSLPVLFRFNATENFHLLVGPQVGFVLAAKGTSSGITTDIKDQLNSTDFNAVVGFGFDFAAFNIGARYNYGFSGIAKNSIGGQKITNSVIQLVVGYRLFKVGK